MKLVACPSCSRPYDVGGVEPGTRLRCACGEVFPVRRETAVAEGVVCGHCGAPVGPGEAACSHCGVSLRTLLCPRCFVRMPEGASHCHGCGAELASQALRPLREGLVCPRCRGELASRSIESASVVECTGCHGLWLEPAVMEALCRRAVSESSPLGAGKMIEVSRSPVAYVPCLNCGDFMARRQFHWGGRSVLVVVDQCRHHGIWLDGGELEQIVEIIRGGRARPAVPEPARVHITRNGRGEGEEGLLGGLLRLLGEALG